MMKIFVITGMDGVGKSTIVKRLLDDNPRLHHATIWDAMNESSFSSKSEVDDYLCSLSTKNRLLFLNNALMKSLEKSKMLKNEFLLFDSYYFKYFASELCLGASKETVTQLMNEYPIPSLVIELSLDVLNASTRKEKFSKYECGLKEATRCNFNKFQLNVKTKWRFFDRTNWYVFSSSKSKDELFLEVNQLILKEMK